VAPVLRGGGCRPLHAVRVTLPPVQNVVQRVGVIITVAHLTVTTYWQWQYSRWLRSLSLYVPAVVGLMATLVAPVLHE
jgi:hypothetical protein